MLTHHQPGPFRDALEPPFFSICIPQYNRTSFLLIALEAYSRQSFGNFEICISDGASDDGRDTEVTSFLQNSGLSFRYFRSPQRLRYDPNLRSSIGLARGRYCLLMGNDDALAATSTLEQLHRCLPEQNFPDVVISNYRETRTNRIVRRIRQGGILGSGPVAAVSHFRDFSFVSGILLSREAAQKFATDKWDGSEMYQMYLGCRILADGGRLLGFDEVTVQRSIQIPGENVESYATRPVIGHCPIQERKLPLCLYGQVALDAVRSGLTPRELAREARRVFQQVLLFTYPPWLVEYRRVQSWRYAAGVALGMRPANLLGPVRPQLPRPLRIWLGCIYLAVTAGGLLVPRHLFRVLRPALYAAAKTRMGL